MKLRWLQRRRIITSAMVQEYADKWSVSMMTAKQEMSSNNTSMVLQYRTWWGQWRDVPYVTEYFE